MSQNFIKESQLSEAIELQSRSNFTLNIFLPKKRNQFPSDYTKQLFEWCYATSMMITNQTFTAFGIANTFNGTFIFWMK